MSAAVGVRVATEEVAAEGARVTVTEVDASRVAVTVEGEGQGEARVSLPLLLRSNVDYGVAVSFKSEDGLSVEASVGSARETGSFVYKGAATGMKAEGLARGFVEAEAGRELGLAVLRGPAISKTGTMRTEGNALEVVLGVLVRPRGGTGRWRAQVTAAGHAAPSIKSHNSFLVEGCESLMARICLLPRRRSRPAPELPRLTAAQIREHIEGTGRVVARLPAGAGLIRALAGELGGARVVVVRLESSE